MVVDDPLLVLELKKVEQSILDKHLAPITMYGG
jgi:hypothetical protein